MDLRGHMTLARVKRGMLAPSLLVGLPGPPAKVPMVSRWPIEVPPEVPDLRRHLVREVLVGPVEGPIGAEVPQEAVRTGSSRCS